MVTGSTDWTTVRESGPLIATAIHAGHSVWPDHATRMVLPEADRLREEDPFTDAWTLYAPTRVAVTLSRFVVDLNRPRDGCVYATPDDAWGLTIYDPPLDESLLVASQTAYDDFYAEMEALLQETVEAHGSAVVLDLHSYNPRRRGPKGEPDDPSGSPELNLGTGTMPARWRPVADACIAALNAPGLDGTAFDARENVRFRGGNLAAWAHDRFCGDVCVLALEAKKTFMDEWTGELDAERHAALGAAFERAAAAVARTREKAEL